MLSRFFEIPSNSSSYKQPVLALVGLLAVCGLVAVLSSTTPSPLLSSLSAEELEFQSFIQAYSKSYSNDEYNSRFQIFRQNLGYIRIYNSMGNTAVLGINHFADMDFKEFKQKYLPFKFPERPEGEDEVHLTPAAVPTSVDWRKQGAVTRVKNQGDCGSCWAFSTTGSVEGAWFLANHTLVSLSEQQLVDCSILFGNRGCNGGTMVDAFKYIIHNKGITSEDIYKYTGQDGICDKLKADRVVANITNFANVPSKNPDALKAAVAVQPVSIGVEADQAAWQMYIGGTITKNCGTNLDHGVLIVGYDTTGVTPYWIVKNSWGATWGMAGYIQIAITTGAGLCGINLQPSYPIV